MFLYVILVSGCHNVDLPNEIENVLQNSGDNEKELLEAISYYKESSDSLKLDALFFLIKNMPKHGAYSDESGNFNESLYNAIDTMNRLDNFNINAVDSIYKTMIQNLRYRPDHTIITADFLINNIENSFYVWENFPWSSDIEFDEFCEYILPYRCSNFPITCHRSPILDRFKYLIEEMPDSASRYFVSTQINNYLIKFWKYSDAVEKYYNPPAFSSILKARRGTCAHEELLKTTIFRSLGIPVAIDFYTSHGWNYILMPEKKSYAFTSFNNPIQNKVPIPNYVPKIFRKMFSVQKSSLAYIENDKSLIPSFFRNPCMLDVTSEYPPFLEKIKIPYNKSTSKDFKYLFLCFADMEHNPNVWVATDWCIKNDSEFAEFNYVKYGLAYLVCGYKQGNLIPVSDAFTIDCDGNIDYRVPEKNSQLSIMLRSKYITKPRIDGFSCRMIDGCFQSSESPLFQNVKDLYRISENPGQKYITVVFEKPQKVKYFRYKSPLFGYCNIAEIELYCNGVNCASEGRLISKTEDLSNAPKAFDNKSITFFESKYPSDGWVGLSFNEYKMIDSIKYLPRTGVNMVEPGKSYKLFYWDEQWISIGIREARNNHIIFENVPDNCLYWLRSIEGGREERVFTFENSKQVWW